MNSFSKLRRCCRIWLLLLLSGPAVSAHAALAQGGEDALSVVHAAVTAELNASKLDHTAWQYRDHDVQPNKDAVYQVIETPKGDLRRLLELNGQPLRGADAQGELDRIRDFVRNAEAQAHKKKAADQDEAQARELLLMLPDAFLWTTSGQNAAEVHLRFQPNPAFNPPDMQSRVLGTMAGEMVVAREGSRIKTLRGTLTQDVRIGFGILGKLEKGGIFDVERRELAPGRWQITETHVHIGGHALLFKTIGEQEDEVKTGWKPATAPDLRAAEEQITR